MPPEASWDFGPVLDLISFDSPDVKSPALGAPRCAMNDKTASSVSERTAENTAITLGSFSKVFERLGISLDAPPPVGSPRESKNNTDDFPQSKVEESASSSRQDGADANKDIHGTLDQLGWCGSDNPFTGLSKKQGANSRKQAWRERQGKEVQEQIKEQLLTTADRALTRNDMSEKSTEENASPKKQPESMASPRKKIEKLASSQKQPERLSSPKKQLERVPSPKKQAEKVSSLKKLRVQTPTRSRSNAGTKVRPTSPVQVYTPAPFQQPPIPTIPVDISAQPHPYTPTPVGTIIHPRASDLQPIVLIPDGVKPTVQSGSPYAHMCMLSPQAPGYSTASPSVQQKALVPLNKIPMNANANAFTPSGAPVPMYNGLIPSSVQPLVSSSKQVQRKFGQEMQISQKRSREDRHFELLTRLMTYFPEDKAWLVAPMRLASDKMVSDGIHVFVDASNILIGFKETLRRCGSDQNLSLSFDCLALLLERRRPVAKRVFAGSTQNHASTSGSARNNTRMQSNEKFTAIAGAVGYEQNIYEQVYKSKSLTTRQKFFRDAERIGWQRATQLHSSADDSSSDPETGLARPVTPPAPKWVEQGVDESLHLKMCQSIIDCSTPTTMVLATGDGASAEYSDGFLAHVERALRNGWNVELVSWKQQTSNGYRNKKFRARWGNMFRIVELDEFLEVLIDA